jgi:hypothetical protein
MVTSGRWPYNAEFKELKRTDTPFTAELNELLERQEASPSSYQMGEVRLPSDPAVLRQTPRPRAPKPGRPPSDKDAPPPGSKREHDRELDSVISTMKVMSPDSRKGRKGGGRKDKDQGGNGGGTEVLAAQREAEFQQVRSFLFTAWACAASLVAGSVWMTLTSTSTSRTVSRATVRLTSCALRCVGWIGRQSMREQYPRNASGGDDGGHDGGFGGRGMGGGYRLRDLCEEDKAKVARLIKKAVQHGQERDRLQEELDSLNSPGGRVDKLRGQNAMIIGEIASLRSKLTNAFALLRKYQAKVHQLSTGAGAPPNPQVECSSPHSSATFFPPWREKASGIEICGELTLTMRRNCG